MLNKDVIQPLSPGVHFPAPPVVYRKHVRGDARESNNNWQVPLRWVWKDGQDFPTPSLGLDSRLDDLTGQGRK